MSITPRARLRPVNASAPAGAPLVSVLLACRNAARFLPDALRGLRDQTYRPIEIVAVDDGSTDATGSILDTFAAENGSVARLRAEGIGPAAARALAFRASSGSLVAIHDADDVSRADRFERQVAALRDRPRLGVLGSAADVIDERGARIGSFPVPLDPRAVRHTLRRAPPFVNGSVLMRRSAYEAAGGFRDAFRSAEDFDLWLRMPADLEMDNLAEPLYAWRRHGANLTARARSVMTFHAAVARAFADERREAGRDSVELLLAHPSEEEFLARYPRAGRVALYFGEMLAREGRAREARRLLGRALRDPRCRGAALPWWGLTWLLPFTPRGRAASRAPAA